jgi:hypothetical protein
MQQKNPAEAGPPSLPFSPANWSPIVPVLMKDSAPVVVLSEHKTLVPLSVRYINPVTGLQQSVMKKGPPER